MVAVAEADDIVDTTDGIADVETGANTVDAPPPPATFVGIVIGDAVIAAIPITGGGFSVDSTVFNGSTGIG